MPAENRLNIFLWNSGSIVPVTNSTGSPGEEFTGNINPSINAKGTRIAFESTLDLTGGNPDRNREIFLADTTTPGIIQVTDTTGGELQYLSIRLSMPTAPALPLCPGPIRPVRTLAVV